MSGMQGKFKQVKGRQGKYRGESLVLLKNKFLCLLLKLHSVCKITYFKCHYSSLQIKSSTLRFTKQFIFIEKSILYKFFKHRANNLLTIIHTST